ncbi:MAG: hypothetical protein P0S94_00175, partial [Simkaniaceae bacterium]|nr:hypothetical protein [Simkaniaceae bacterium]
GMFDYAQLIEMLRILPDKHEIVTIGIEENGIESCEALLLARHFMHRRVYQYASVKAYSYHLQNFMTETYVNKIDDLKAYVELTDNEVTTQMHRAAADPTMTGHYHAACLIDGEKRYHALPISSPHVLEKITLPEVGYATELGKLKQGGGLDFPVLMNDGSIRPGSEVSDVYVPQTNKNWVYVEPGSASAMKTILREKR